MTTPVYKMEDYKTSRYTQKEPFDYGLLKESNKFTSLKGLAMKMRESLSPDKRRIPTRNVTFKDHTIKPVIKQSYPLPESNVIRVSNAPIKSIKYSTVDVNGNLKSEVLGYGKPAQSWIDNKAPEKPLYKSERVSSKPNNLETFKSAFNNNTAYDLKETEYMSRNDVMVDIETNNRVNELRVQNRMKQTQLDRLESENMKYKRDADNLYIVRGRLEENELEKKKLEANSLHLESTIKQLKQEVERLNNKNYSLQSQINSVLNHNPDHFKYDPNNEHIYTKREWELIEENKQLSNKVFQTEKERDKLYVENFEFKKNAGIKEVDLNETDEDILKMNYENNLQVSELNIKRLERKLKRIEEENTILHNELNILRSLDILDEDSLKGKLISSA